MHPILQTVLLLLLPGWIAAQVNISNSTQVTPRCGSQLISIELNFDPAQLHDGKFFDWIVVGVSGRPECRLKGNGETKYVIEIAVFNDPCLTQIPARNVFQNRIRIGKNPVVILDGDQSVTVKCVYGLPTVETLAMPVINHNFNIDNSARPNIDWDASNNEVQKIEQFPDSSVAKVIPIAQESENTMTIDEKNSHNGLFALGNKDNVEQELWSKDPVVNPSNANVLTGGFTETPSNQKSRFFPLFFIIGVPFLIVLCLLLFLCGYLFITKRRTEQNRKRFIGSISRDEERNATNRMWWTDGSTEGYSTPKEPGRSASRKTREKDGKLFTSSAVTSERLTRTHTKHFAQPSIAVPEKNLLSTIARTDSGHVILSKKKDPADLSHSSAVPLRSNLEEFVSKTFAIGEYNELSSPAYAYAEPFSEREVDVGVLKKQSNPKGQMPASDDAVSSFRSVTEFIHAAETTDLSPTNTMKPPLKLGILMDCVLNIRGFGCRKLTEQEIGRWRNLIQKDTNLYQALVVSRSVSEIEELFDREQYRHMFSSSKWQEIAECVHKALIKKSDFGKSRSQLQLFVGDVHTDW